MATLQVNITPLTVPETVTVMVGEYTVDVPVSELDEETIVSLVEDFTNTLFEKLPK